MPGRHPLDYQPLCQETQMAWCSLRHWKHPLIRWDRSGPEVRPDYGFHRVRAPVRVKEPREGVFMHHFQYRNRPETAERLRRLCEPREDGVVRSALDDAFQERDSAARRRWATLDYVYSQDWAHVERQTLRGSRSGVDPRPWTSLVSPVDASVARWYSAEMAQDSLNREWRDCRRRLPRLVAGAAHVPHRGRHLADTRLVHAPGTGQS